MFEIIPPRPYEILLKDAGLNIQRFREHGYAYQSIKRFMAGANGMNKAKDIIGIINSGLEAYGIAYDCNAFQMLGDYENTFDFSMKNTWLVKVSCLADIIESLGGAKAVSAELVIKASAPKIRKYAKEGIHERFRNNFKIAILGLAKKYRMQYVSLYGTPFIARDGFNELHDLFSEYKRV